MKKVCLIVLVAAMVALSACSVLDAWGEQEAEKARGLSLDNAAKQSAINDRDRRGESAPSDCDRARGKLSRQCHRDGIGA